VNRASRQDDSGALPESTLMLDQPFLVIVRDYKGKNVDTSRFTMDSLDSAALLARVFQSEDGNSAAIIDQTTNEPKS
jgi:hypothetical protein